MSLPQARVETTASDARPLISPVRLELLPWLPTMLTQVHVLTQMVAECPARTAVDTRRGMAAMSADGLLASAPVSLLEPSKLDFGVYATICRTLRIGAGLPAIANRADRIAQLIELLRAGGHCRSQAASADARAIVGETLS